MTHDKIDSFTGDYAYLSNFFQCFVIYDGRGYKSSEHAFQAAKAIDPKEKKAIQRAKTPGKAKRLGRMCECRTDWDSVKINVMREILMDKFTRHKDLQRKLLDTGDATLIEGNTWKDTFWGVYNGYGKNWLGKILMEVRDVLKHTG